MSLRSVLPKVRNESESDDELDLDGALRAVATYVDDASKCTAPPYGSRDGWVPTTEADFMDGGAYPEIPIVQYPRNMGKIKQTKSNAIPIPIDSSGKIKYDALLRKDEFDKKKIIHYKFDDLLPLSMKDETDPSFQKPDEDEIKRITEETRNALEQKVCSKIDSSLPNKGAYKQEEPKYIRYTPGQGGEKFNSGAEQRIIKITEAQRDPMSPPRFKINAKVPITPGSPPAPVLHSPPRKVFKIAITFISKVTVEEQNEWKIPPCISSWKNPKGYVIPLDKRLATDGRGLRDPHINDKFAKLAESLYIADRKAREAVEMRAQMEKRVLQKEKEQQEEKLKELARQAREERRIIQEQHVPDEDEVDRDMLRNERHRERERDRRIAKTRNNKKSKHIRNKERDVSEMVALGVPSNQPSHEALFDQRLFNQTQGLDSGFAGGQDDVYNVYDQPWKKGDNRSAMYKPSKNLETEIYGQELENIIKTDRFVNNTGLLGSNEAVGTRQGPVQFEKNKNEDYDPFELDQFLSEAKRGRKRNRDKD